MSTRPRLSLRKTTLGLEPRLQLRLTRQSGRLAVALVLVALAAAARLLVPVLAPGAAATAFAATGQLSLDKVVTVAGNTVLIGCFFVVLWFALVTWAPKLRAALELSALAYLIACALPLVVPQVSARVQASDLVLALVGVTLLRYLLIHSGLPTLSLPWRMRLEHTVELPLSPTEVWARLRPVPGHPALYFDPTCIAIQKPDSLGVIRMDHRFRPGAHSRWMHIAHEQPGRLMSRTYGTTSEAAAAGRDVDTIRLEPIAGGTRVVATELPAASLRLWVARWMDDFQADYWDRACAHILGIEDGSLFGALMDPARIPEPEPVGELDTLRRSKA